MILSGYLGVIVERRSREHVVNGLQKHLSHTFLTLGYWESITGVENHPFIEHL